MKDTLILGRVKEINQFDLQIGLAGGLTGVVKIFDISDAYKKQLEQLVNEDLSTKNVADLASLFQIGQFVRCFVKSTKGSKSQRVELSLNPRLVHSQTPRHQISDRMCFHGAVSSIEDHGFVIDLGLKGLQCFLPAAKTTSYVEQCNQGRPLSIGSIVPCKITNKEFMSIASGDSRVVRLTAEPNKIEETILVNAVPVHFGCIVPGMCLRAQIHKVVGHNLVIKFQNYFVAINKTQYVGILDEFTNTQEITVCVLKVDSMTKKIEGSLLPHLLPGRNHIEDFQRVVMASIHKDAVVRKIEKRSLQLWLPTLAVKAIVKKDHVTDKASEVENLKNNFHKGDTVTCRVIDFDLMENVAIVSLKESIIKQTFLRYEDIKPADLITGEIVRFSKMGVVVKFSTRIQGLVPYLHLSNVPLANPTDKFSSGDKLKCRALSIDPKEKKLILTAKPTLVRSKTVPVTKESQLKPGMLICGFVAQTQNVGILVVFYNNIKGWVKRQELGISESDLVDKTFYRGQVVTCRVIKYDQSTKNLHLSLKLEGKMEIGTAHKRKLENVDVHVGQVYTCTVTSKHKSILDVALKGHPGIPVHLPLNHLSDSSSTASLIGQTSLVGVSMRVVVVTKGTSVIVSAKPSLIVAAEESCFPETFEQLQVGSQWLGWVQNKQKYGLFVEFPSGLRGLVPNKLIVDGSPPFSPLDIYQEGQTVEAKVVEVDQEKMRCLLTLRMSSVHHTGEHLNTASLDPLQRMLDQRSALATKGIFCRPSSSYTLGQQVRVKIASTNELGVLCDVIADGPTSSVRGIALMSNTQGVTCVTGSILPAIVLYVDLAEDCIEVCLSTHVVKGAAEHRDNKSSRAREGQQIKSEVVLVKPDFVVVMLLGHAHGKLAYLPAKRHWNDCFQVNKYIVGQKNPVVVKRVLEDGTAFCNLKIHEPIESNAPSTGKKSSTSPSKVEIGSQLTVVVAESLDLQLNVSVPDRSSLRGRIFVSEATDDPLTGINPLTNFQSGQTLQASVIGFRKDESKKKLNPLFSSNLLECSLRSKHCNKEIFEPGDKCPVYFYSRNINKLFFVTDPFRSSESRAFCSVLNSGRTSHEVKRFMSEDLVVGSAFPHALVIKDTGQKTEVTLLGSVDLAAGQLVCARIVKIGRLQCFLALPNGARGSLHIFDMPWTECVASGKKKENKKNDTNAVDWPVRASDVMTKKKRGELITCRLLTVNATTKKGQFSVTARQSAVKNTDSSYIPPEIVRPPSVGEITRGYISRKNSNGLVVSLTRDIDGVVRMTKKHCLSKFETGELVHVDVITVTGGRYVLKLTGESAARLGNVDPVADTVQLLSHGVHDDDDEENSDAMDTDNEEELALIDPLLASNRSKSSVKIEHVRIPATNHVGMSIADLLAIAPENNKSPVVSDDEEEDDVKSNSSDDVGVERKKPRLDIPALPKSEHSDGPRSVEEFDAAVKNSPDSAAAWTSYMAFYLQAGQIDLARSVAERGLNTINIREEGERANLFIALMNMEASCGEDADFQRVFLKASQMDNSEVFRKAYACQMKVGNKQIAEDVARRFVKRCPQKVEAWLLLMRARFEGEKATQARETLHNALSSLKTPQHVDLLIKTGNLEFELGELDRGVKVYKELLSTYPTKLYIHLAYIQALVLAGKEEDARTARNKALTCVKAKDKHRIEDLTV